MALYQPDRAFLAKLKRLDPKLGCEFRESIGFFVITYDRAHAPGKKAMVLTIKTKDGKFRHPDERDIETLHNGDMQNPRVCETVMKMAEFYEQHRACRDKFRRDEMKHAIYESRRQLMPRMARAIGASKGNSTFRRITPKPRGKVF